MTPMSRMTGPHARRHRGGIDTPPERRSARSPATTFPGLGAIPLLEVQGSLEVSEHPAMNTADAEAFAAGIDVWGETIVCGNADELACP